MSGQTERMHTRLTESRLCSKASSHRRRAASSDGGVAVQQRDAVIHRQQAKLAQYVSVSKRIIEEFLGVDRNTIEDVSPHELLKVVDYVKLMRSSVEIFQTINEALKERIDELLSVSHRDEEILRSVLTYLQSLPVLHAARDERTNELKYQIDFNSDHSIQVSTSEGAAANGGNRCRGRRVRWLMNAVSAVACVVIGTSVAKSGLGRSRGNA